MNLGGPLSIFPPLPPQAWTWRRAQPPPFPLVDPSCKIFAQARQGLWQALRRLLISPADELLMPAYHHGSEVETARNVGFEPRFYGATDTLEPDEDELASLVGPRTRGLYLIHPLGFVRDGSRWRRWCDARGLTLVEDAAQAWLSARDGVPTGAAGDVSIFCLYKMVGVPDGGAVRTVEGLGPTCPPSPERAAGPGSVARMHRKYLSQRVGGLLAQPEHSYGGALQEEVPEVSFSASPTGREATWPTRFLAGRVDGQRVVARRRRNYVLLRERLEDHFSQAFEPLQEGGCPLAYPIESEDKEGILNHLAQHGIFDGQMWTVRHPLLPPGRYALSESLRRRLIGLPLHQELTGRDIERIGEAASGWFAAGGR